MVWPPGTAWVGECVRWPSTVRPKQHVAWHDTLEATLWHDYHCFNAISRQTLNPKSYILSPKPEILNPDQTHKHTSTSQRPQRRSVHRTRATLSARISKLWYRAVYGLGFRGVSQTWIGTHRGNVGVILG